MKKAKKMDIAKIAVLHQGSEIWHQFVIENWEAPIHTGYIMDSGHTLCRKCCSAAVAKVGLSIVGMRSTNDHVDCENQNCEGGK